jgi:acetyl esterase/lipase
VTAHKKDETTHPIPQEAFDWYDEYAHGLISRREFVNRLSTLTDLGFTVSALSAALMPNYALAEQVSFNDPDIKAPLLIQLAELDERVNATWPEYEKDLKASKSPFTMHMYPGVNHGFHNDSTGRYNEAAAELAWSRTIEFFKKHLAV